MRIWEKGNNRYSSIDSIFSRTLSSALAWQPAKHVSLCLLHSKTSIIKHFTFRLYLYVSLFPCGLARSSDFQRNLGFDSGFWCGKREVGHGLDSPKDEHRSFFPFRFWSSNGWFLKRGYHKSLNIIFKSVNFARKLHAACERRRGDHNSTP